jgi:hypothetical protein
MNRALFAKRNSGTMIWEKLVGARRLLALTIFITLFTLPASAFADVWCDKKANFLRNEMARAWSMAQRGDDGVLRDAWTDAFTVRLYPSCRLSYDEYFSPRKKKAPTVNKSKSEGDVPRASAPEKKVNVDPDPEWANATRERILKGEKPGTVSVKEDVNRTAPYGPSNCVTIVPAPKRGDLDWDFVVIKNVCSYPIKALTCYHERGREGDCVPRRGARNWGQSDLLQPGASQETVMFNVKRGLAKAKIIVCDMRQKSDLLCVLPN